MKFKKKKLVKFSVETGFLCHCPALKRQSAEKLAVCCDLLEKIRGIQNEMLRQYNRQMRVRIDFASVFTINLKEESRPSNQVVFAEIDLTLCVITNTEPFLHTVLSNDAGLLEEQHHLKQQNRDNT